MAASAILFHIVLSIGLIDWFCVMQMLQPCTRQSAVAFLYVFLLTKWVKEQLQIWDLLRFKKHLFDNLIWEKH